MKHTLYIVFVLFIFSFGLKAQDHNPAQVSKPVLWLLGKKKQEHYSLENRTITASLTTKLDSKGELLNFNPALFFDGKTNTITMALDSLQMKQQTLFFVYKLKDSVAEQILWNVTDPNKTSSLATTKRLVNLNGYNYKSYPSTIKPRKPNLHIYQHNRSDLKAKSFQLSFGATTTNERLPPLPLTTLISELIVYDRVLSPIETQKVASYLAIKYGIPLSQLETKNYLNSQGTTIWKQENHKGFEESITAIGRDDKSNLWQIKSSNAFENNLLTVGFNGDINDIPDTYFVFWSDNGKALTVKKQEQGQPDGISRKWILDYLQQNKSGLDWEFDASQIKKNKALDPALYYWLQVDQSGTGNFEAKDLEYTLLAPISNTEKLQLKEYSWDPKGTGKVAFSIKVAPAMFANVTIVKPSCGLIQSGNIQFKIEGGKGPFEIHLTNTKSETIIKNWVQEATTNQLIKIDSGYYEYVVTDAQKNTYKETFYVPDSNGIVIPFQSQYTLLVGQTLSLDTQLVLPEDNYTYEWFYEGNRISTAASLNTSQSGDYELRLENSEGCKSMKQFSVQVSGEKLLSETKIMVYPNPSIDGRFTVEALFPNETSGTVCIFTISGQKIIEDFFAPQQNLRYHGELPTSGVYIIKINSFFGEENIKLIVK
ncbi:T9SS type A sorting domain-containing protein [Flavobacterium sp.]|uniref:T9SS type A sorting domain-containing protein n=1 Tax=Flavobacterium sp. TaxID=239 RepID=UPI003C4E0A81